MGLRERNASRPPAAPALRRGSSAAELHTLLREGLQAFEKDRDRSVDVRIDVDPVDLL